VEDFITGEIENSKIKNQLIDFWSLDHLIDEKSCVDNLNRAEGKVKEIVDLTDFVDKKNRTISTLSIKLLSALKFIAPFPILRNLCSIFIGGLILDRLYADGLMEYKFIRFQKVENP
jgi:hypothetical protein